MKKISLITILLLVPIIVLGQFKTTTNYYDKEWRECDSISARIIIINSFADSTLKRGTAKTVNADGQIKSECEFADLNNNLRDGKSSYYHENGQLKSMALYKNGKLNGELKTYYSSGQLKRSDVYENGELSYGKCYSITGEDTTYFEYLIMPRYVGGEAGLFSFLKENVVYPKKARRKRITGKVSVKFTIDYTGTVKNIRVENPIHPLLDKEALRVVNLFDKWIPGKQDGENVSVEFSLPISFKLM